MCPGEAQVLNSASADWVFGGLGCRRAVTGVTGDRWVPLAHLALSADWCSFRAPSMFSLGLGRAA